MNNAPMDNEQVHKQGVSPLLVLLLMSGLLGLVMAGIVFLSDSNDDSRPSNINNSNAAAIATPVSALERPAEDFQLTDINGQLVSLSQFRGRPVFINLWYTDCPPCVREFPAFQQFMEEQGDDGAVVLAVNQGDDLDEIRDFLSDLGITGVPVLLDTDLSINTKYPYNVFPTTYLVDEAGNVRFRALGEITLGKMYEFLDALETDA